MKRLILALLASAVLLFGQASGVGSIWSSVNGTMQSAAVANGNGNTLSVMGLSAVAITVNCSVACSGGTTINFEGSEDGTNYSAINGQQMGTCSIASTVTNQGTTPTVWEVNAAGLQLVRARISGYSAGTVTVTAHATAAPFNPKCSQANTFLGGTAADGNSGNKSAATQRVVIATDQPQLTNKLLVTPDSVALPANQSVNTSQINGVTPLMGNGTTGTGSQRVTIASDNTAFGVNATLGAETTKVIGTARVIGNGGATLDSAPQATAPTNVMGIGAAAVNAEQTAATNGQAQRVVTDLVGKLINLPYANPENFVSGATTAQTVGTAVSVISSAGGSLRNYITGCQVVNTSSTNTFIQILDGASTVLATIPLPANGGAVINFPVPLKGTAATATEAITGTAITSWYASCQGYKGL